MSELIPCWCCRAPGLACGCSHRMACPTARKCAKHCKCENCPHCGRQYRDGLTAGTATIPAMRDRGLALSYGE